MSAKVKADTTHPAFRGHVMRRDAYDVHTSRGSVFTTESRPHVHNDPGFFAPFGNVMDTEAQSHFVASRYGATRSR